MRILVIVIAVATLAWSGYWLIGSRQAAQGVDNWVAARNADGWDISATKVRTRGFPNRFDTTFTAPKVFLPDGGYGWTAPFFQIMRLSYNPRHAILIFPNSQIVTRAGQTVAISSASMQASVVVDAGTLDLNRANLVAKAGSLVFESGWPLRLGNVLAAIRKTPATTQSYDLALDLRDVSIPGLARPLIDRLRIDVNATLGAALDLDAIGTWRLDGTQVEVREFQAKFDTWEISATGGIALDDFGNATGRIKVQTDSWEQMVKIVGEMNLVSQPALVALSTEMARLAAAQGDLQRLEFDLNIRRGAVFLGPIQLQ